MTEKAWKYSDKPTPDLVYFDVDTGKYYYLYDANDFITTDEPVFMSYDVGTVKPHGLTNDRQLPEIVTTAPGILLGHTALSASTISEAYDDLDDFNPAEIFEQTIELYQEYAPWFYETIKDEEGNVTDAPGMSLLLEHLWLGRPIAENDPRLLQLKGKYTIGQLRFINAGGLKNNDYETNARLRELRGGSKDTIDATLTKIGIDVDDFVEGNFDNYQNLIELVTQGKIIDTDLDDFLKHFTGISVLTEKDSRYLSFKNVIEEEVESKLKFDLGSLDFRKTKAAERLGTRYLGQMKYMSLDEETKKEISYLVSTDQQDAAEQKLQQIFDSDPYFERFSGKGLNYGQVVGPYKQLYTSIYGESADETDPMFFEFVGMSFQDAAKAMRKNAYESGNQFFGRRVAQSMNQSLGGNVIRGI